MCIHRNHPLNKRLLFDFRQFMAIGVSFRPIYRASEAIVEGRTRDIEFSYCSSDQGNLFIPNSFNS